MVKTILGGIFTEMRYPKKNIYEKEKDITSILLNDFPDRKNVKDHIHFQKINDPSYCAIFLDRLVYFAEKTPLNVFIENSKKCISDILEILEVKNEIQRMGIRFQLAWKTENIKKAVNLINRKFMNIPNYLGDHIHHAGFSFSCTFDKHALNVKFQPETFQEIEVNEKGVISNNINSFLSADCDVYKNGPLQYASYFELLKLLDLTIVNQIIPMVERALDNE